MELGAKAIQLCQNPVQTLINAYRAECGFDPFPNELLQDYAARAAGTSREVFDRYGSIIRNGAKVPAEMAELHAWSERVGKRAVLLIIQERLGITGDAVQERKVNVGRAGKR